MPRLDVEATRSDLRKDASVLRLDEALARARAEDAPRRRRSARALANDTTISSKAIEYIAEHGWDPLTFSELAKRAGLTVGAVYGRAENKAELGTELWTTRIGGDLRSAVLALIHDPDPIHAVRLWQRGPDTLRAACELLTAAVFDEDLAEVIGRDIRRMLQDVVGPEVEPTRAAARTLVIAELMGQTLCNVNADHPDSTRDDMAQRALRIRTAWSPPAMQNQAPAEEIEWVRRWESDDPHRDVLELAALECVGRVGYRRATVARMCRRGQLSSGSMFARFDSKDALIASAYSTHLHPPEELASRVSAEALRVGYVSASSRFIADYLNPKNSVIRTLWLELSRLHGRNGALGIDVPHDALGQANLGLGLLCHYQPQLRNLPFTAALGVYIGSI